MAAKLKGTKERIFDVAIKLFAQEGFENISMRNISEEVGIHVSSLYNHFASKEEMLEEMYQYFGIHRHDNRNADRLMKEIIENDSALEIMRALSETVIEFDEKETKKKTVRLVLITKIILMRIYQDEKANQFFLHDWYETDIAYLQKWLGYAVEIGRLGKDFDIEIFSKCFWRQLIAMGICAFADPKYEERQWDEEEQLINMFARSLPLKNPVKWQKEIKD